MFWRVALIVNLMVINLGLGWLFYREYFMSNVNEVSIERPVVNSQGEAITYIDKCGLDCKNTISAEIDKLSKSLMVPVTPTPTVVVSAPKVVSTTKTKVRSVSYVTIPGSGSTLENNWVDLAGTDFYFDTKDYPGLVEVYFEGNIKLFNGNGTAYVRLYDTNNGVGVQGSDISTSSQLSALNTSGKVTFWSGKNKIRVQAKSLTADTAIFESGRLRVVVEN